MAPAILGYHKLVECPQCGHAFAVNASAEADHGLGLRVTSCVCPNCRQPVHFEAARAEDGRQAGGSTIASPALINGDRVLVGKGLFGPGLFPPQRFDLVVFPFQPAPRASDLPEDEPPAPLAPPPLYVKRLIGLPGETIAIHRGKLYFLPPGQGNDHDDFKNAEGDASKTALLWLPERMHRDEDGARKLFQEGKFTPLPKPPATVLAQRHLVYDNDHPARNLNGAEGQRWSAEPKSAWTAVEGAGSRHEPGASSETRWLRYRHLLPDGGEWFQLTPQSLDALREARVADGVLKRLAKLSHQPAEPRDTFLQNLSQALEPFELAQLEGEVVRAARQPARFRQEIITDFVGYNSWLAARGAILDRGNWASDLHLECEVSVDGAAGELVLELARGPDRFQARFDLAGNSCALLRVTGSKSEELDRKPVTLRPRTAHRLRFASADDRLLVWVGDALPFGDGVAQPTPTCARPGRLTSSGRSVSGRKAWA